MGERVRWRTSANARRAHAQDAHCIPDSVTEADTTMGSGGR